MEIVAFFFNDIVHFTGLCVVIVLFGVFCCPLFMGGDE